MSGGQRPATTEVRLFGEVPLPDTNEALKTGFENNNHNGYGSGLDSAIGSVLNSSEEELNIRPKRHVGTDINPQNYAVIDIEVAGDDDGELFIVLFVF
jgi:hypothetical protein